MALLGLILVASACAPQRSGAGSADGARSRYTDGPSRLSVALLVEPADIMNKFGIDGGADYQFIFSAALTHRDSAGNIVPVLAASVPSLDDGTWKAHPDGTMETTWRIRPGARWHDGAPLTVHDFVWEWELSADRDLPTTVRVPNSLITRIDTPDDHTMVMHWRQPYILANAIAGNVGEPIPRHLLEDLYRADKQKFLNSPYWAPDFVGLGPYRVSEWAVGSHVRGRAFDNYVLGRPRIEEITVKFIPDTNTVMANILAGELDVSLQNTIRGQQALVVREQWVDAGKGTMLVLPVKHRYTEVQYRPLWDGKPNPAARDVRVRAALVHGLDRAQLTEALLHGLGELADMYLNPGDAAFDAASRAIKKYPFDLATASRLLAEAGWMKAADGILANPAGERFTLELRTTAEEVNEQEVAIMADMWKRNLGIDTHTFVIPQAKQKDDEFRALFPGVSNSATSIGPTWLDKFQSARIPGPDTRWRGGNRGAYSSPIFDAGYERYISTLADLERRQVLVDLIRFASEDLTYLPLYYQVDVHAIRKGLKGPGPRWPGQSGLTWNIHEWFWE